MYRILAKIAVCVFLVTTACGCLSPQQVAQREVSQEITSRQQMKNQSLKEYEDAKSAYGKGKLDAAREKALLAVRNDSSNIFALMLLGQIEFDSQKIYESAEAFRRASKIAPDRYEPHYNLGIIFESVGKTADAIGAYETALELSPDQLVVMENLVRCYVRSGKSRERSRYLIDKSLAMENRPEWRQWLSLQNVRLSQPDMAMPPASQPSPE